MRLLLDTCTFLWLSQQPSRLSTAAAQAIDNSANGLFVSDISVWEITLKHATGKLPLPGVPRDWIPRKLEFHQLQSLTPKLSDFFRCGELPRTHRDPFDRLLAAQAIEQELVLVSPDHPLSDLGAARIW